MVNETAKYNVKFVFGKFSPFCWYYKTYIKKTPSKSKNLKGVFNFVLKKVSFIVSQI